MTRTRAGQAVVFLLAIHHAGVRAAPASGRTRIQHQRLADAGELLALADDRLLAWGDRGAAYLMSPEGTWTAEIHLPFTHVWQVVPDGRAFLALGQTPGDVQAVILFDEHAKELQRWTPPGLGWGLLVVGARRWNIQPAGLVELLPGGRVGPLEPFPESPGASQNREPSVFQHDGRRLICYGTNRSMEHFGWANCRPIGGQLWKIKDGSMSPPIACGRWVIAAVGRDPQTLAVFSFDGQLVARRKYPRDPVFACGEPDMIVVGAGRVVEVATLPELAPRWTHRVARGPVVTVAAVRTAVAFGTETSSDVVVAPR